MDRISKELNMGTRAQACRDAKSAREKAKADKCFRSDAADDNINIKWLPYLSHVSEIYRDLRHPPYNLPQPARHREDVARHPC